MANTRLNRAGVRELLGSAGVRAMVTAKAAPVLAAAKADPHDDTGAYEASLQIVQATTGGYRGVARVISTDPKALILESKYGILARAIGAA